MKKLFYLIFILLAFNISLNAISEEKKDISFVVPGLHSIVNNSLNVVSIRLSILENKKKVEPVQHIPKTEEVKTMYSTIEDIMKMKDPLVIANWIKLEIPDVISSERYQYMLSKLTDEEKITFQRIYTVDYNNEYNRDLNIDFNDKIFLFNLNCRIYGNLVIDETIKDVDSEIDLILASGGYCVPIKESSKSSSIVKRWSKYLTLYYLMLNGGVLDVEADKKFISMCETIQEELKMLAKGDLKLPLDDIKTIDIKSESKIVTDWNRY